MSQPAGIVVRDLEPADTEAAVEVLTASFVDFPAIRVLVGTGDGARERTRRVFAMELDPASPNQALVAEHDGAIAGVLTYADSPRCAEAGVARSISFVRVAGPRIFASLRLFGRISRVHPASPHRHLPSVGVLPTSQGHGVGRALMEEFHRRCDDARLPAYLETIRWADAGLPSLERFYRSLGYEVDDVVPGDDVWSVVTMTRPVSAAGDS